MATTVMCNVVHLAQQPPPVHIPTERVSLPNPIPSQHGHRRPARENHGGFRWHRPAFQPFQLKPWAKDPDVEEEMRESLAVIGPNTIVDFSRLSHSNGSQLSFQQQNSHARTFTAPPAIVSSLEMRKSDPAEKKEAPAKTLSSPIIRDLLTPATKRSVATFPARPPFSRGKQIPGRFFPKPTLTEEQRVQIELFKRMKPPPRKASSLVSATPSRRVRSVGDRDRVPVFDSVERTAAVFDASSPTVSNVMDRQHSASFNRRIARNRQQLQKDSRRELRSEVFAICFKQDLDTVTTAYDPNSELHSDYYSIKRLKMPVARLGRAVKTNIDDFAVVLRGHSKHLHKKFLMSTGSMESLDSILPSAHAAAAPSGGSLTRRTVHDERDPSPRKIIDIETPMANGGGRESDEHTDGSGADQDQDNTLAPLNSPTGTCDQKDSFPALN